MTTPLPNPYATSAAERAIAGMQNVFPNGDWSTPAPPPKALNTQVGGNHYKDLKIQPVEYIHANGIGYFEGNVIKYVTRWRTKGGNADLLKAKHYIELLLDLEAKAE